MSDKSHKFSIVTINFNNSEGLETTIKSVISQGFKDYEFLIIDGGSTDGSLDVINKYSKKVSFWISEPDNGIFDALNKGIKIAKGEYLIFMNSGDCFYDSKILEIYNRHINTDAQIYYGNCLGMYNDGKELSMISPEVLDIKFWLFSCINHQSSAINRKLFDLYGVYDDSLRIVADWKWFFELFDKYKVNFQKINEYVAIYDMHGVSSDSKFWPLHLGEREKVIKEVFPSYWTTYLDLDQFYKIKPADIKRQRHFDFIKKHPFSYRLLKSFMDILLMFRPYKKDR